MLKQQAMTFLLRLLVLSLFFAGFGVSKPVPLLTVKNTDGDTIDCFRIREQPAFDLQLLRDHVVQEKPSEIPKLVTKYENGTESHVWRSMNGTICPEGTVPIRRDMHSSTKGSYKKHPRVPKVVGNVSSPTDHEYGTGSTRNLSKIYGAKATINVWEPRVQEGVNEFSLSQIWIISGSYDKGDLNTIEAGWQVFPEVYGDNKPRLFTYWTNDAYQTSGCYSVRGPGFIQTSRNVALDTAISPVSSFGSSQFEFTILIWKDLKYGNWWMGIGPDVELIGYWPAEIFTTLADHATEVQWGGEIVNSHSSGRHTTTQMGSGYFAEAGFRKASYIRNIEVVDSHNTLRPVDSLRVQAHEPQYYSIKESFSNEWGVHFFYGGPGFNPRRSASECLPLDFFFLFLCFGLLIV